jgi:hypothetical protein
MKTKIQKVMVGALGAVAATAGLVALEASPAMAACSSGTNSVCIGYDTRGYDALFLKRSGPAVYVTFNLKCNNGRWFGDNGAFRAYAGNNYSYTFAVGSQGTCHVQLLDANNGAVLLRSPDLNR